MAIECYWVNQRRRALMKWETLSKAEKYSTEMQKVPFNLSIRVCLALDIYRCDGKDVREFASKQNITVSEFAHLKQVANIQKTTITSVILQRTPGITVGDLVNILKQMERQDIVDLINEWYWMVGAPFVCFYMHSEDVTNSLYCLTISWLIASWKDLAEMKTDKVNSTRIVSYKDLSNWKEEAWKKKSKKIRALTG